MTAVKEKLWPELVAGAFCPASNFEKSANNEKNMRLDTLLIHFSMFLQAFCTERDSSQSRGSSSGLPRDKGDSLELCD